MHEDDDSSRLSRRRLLRASAAATTLSVVGTGQASAGRWSDLEVGPSSDRRCPDATTQPSMGHCAGSSVEGCADDHPVTRELRAAVDETLTERYPDAGALIDAGFKPYFDAFDVADEDGWSHWLSPEYIGDGEVLDPDRPESVLVDNATWRSIGVMFIATRGGEPVEPPPVYDDGDGSEWNDDGDRSEDGPDDESGDAGEDELDVAYATDMEEGEHHSDDHHDGPDHDHPPGDADRCSPWHYHAGFPGRFAWWYYRQVYERDFEERDLEFPCRTPCMMHVWTVDHPEGVYAHGGPPAEFRPDAPADDPGFDTDATPGEDDLEWTVLPEDARPDRTPDELSLLGP
ncbi:hypothetical protein [Natrarchaeobius oligotrophus]|uniref:Uncharacterized protein n=1 Tax=Natrarchaeobius chitinivorans TaxID=1679083 RepID=A0A3N6PJM8_NATCH|nr:hypothetical protein [Natrarchaeobius chitinivorans]RQG98795.1 hypothetical protein EA472_16380 [Natrarchaeobius chitinivorans]